VHRAGLLLLILPLVVGLAGCAEPRPAAPGAAAGGSAATTPTTQLDADLSTSSPTAAAPGDSSASPSSAPRTSASSGSGSAAPKACKQAALRVDVVQGDSGAGNETREIVFTNESDVTCTLRGAPDVFVLDADGSQVGRAAEPTGQAVTTARIRPHGAARATLTSVNIGTDGGPLGEACAPVDGNGYAVTAPGSTRFTTVKHGVPACTGDQVWMRISPVVVDRGSEG